MRAFVFVGADNPKAKLSHAHERAITSIHTKYIISSPKLLFLSSFSFIGFTFVSLFTLFFFFYFYYCYCYCCLCFTLSLFSMAHTTPLEQNHNNFDYDPAGMEMEMQMERHRKRRKKWKEEVVDVPLRRDPLEVFGMDIMLKILSYLDARSVALSLLVSRAWHAVASTDRLWASKLEELWLGKAHIPRLSQIRGLSKLAAYSLAVVDGKRNRIMKEDLCDHVWEFHFNKAAPDYWRNLDPYWKGTGRPMRRYFHPDGSQSADPGDKVWGGHECCYLTVTSIVGEDKIREHYVRINRWPRMSVFRKQDWSWELSNHLYSYSSIPDADKEGGTGPLYDV